MSLPERAGVDAVGAAVTEPAGAVHGLAAAAAAGVYGGAALVERLDGRVPAQLHHAVRQRVHLIARQQICSKMLLLHTLRMQHTFPLLHINMHFAKNV